MHMRAAKVKLAEVFGRCRSRFNPVLKNLFAGMTNGLTDDCRFHRPRLSAVSPHRRNP